MMTKEIAKQINDCYSVLESRERLIKDLKKQDVDGLIKRINKGIWESRKCKAKQLTKQLLIGIWTVTIFPLMLLWIFITNKLSD